MKKYAVYVALILGFCYLSGCSRKTTPAKTTEEPVIKIDPPPAPKRPAPIKTAVPKSIVVNDKAATKTVQGRYYYDLEGKRYWRSKKDGKYYLYYQGMFEKPEFQ